MQTDTNKEGVDSTLECIIDRGVGHKTAKIMDRRGGAIDCSHTSKGKEVKRNNTMDPHYPHFAVNTGKPVLIIVMTRNSHLVTCKFT